MSDDITDEVEMAEPEQEIDEAVEQEPEGDPTEGLKKALAAERKAHKEADRRAKALEQQLVDKDRPAEEMAIEQARREGREEALKVSDERIKRAELKAALAGKVTNLGTALKLIDTSGIEVDSNGDVDSDAVEAAIEALLADTPELAVSAKRFQGSADQGAGRQSAPKQITRDQLLKMSPDEVNKARRDGRLNALMGVN